VQEIHNFQSTKTHKSADKKIPTGRTVIIKLFASCVIHEKNARRIQRKATKNMLQGAQNSQKYCTRQKPYETTEKHIT